MDTVSRLKWIPMLVKAYSDARVQRELALRSQETASSGNGNHSEEPDETDKLSPVPLKQAVRRKLPRRSRPSRPVQKFKPIPNRRGSSHSHKGMANSKGQNWKRLEDSHYKSVLVELQETKRKLSRLESIHTEMAQMQQKLDEKLLDLFHRLDSGSETFPAEQKVPVTHDSRR